jgi:hypothetical protein
MNYEQRIKEARTIEAMRNGYMGLGGKFSQITKKLGFAIIKQGGLYVDSTNFEDIFESEEEAITTIDEDEPTYEIGWQFDALSRGINLSITIMHHLREIVVRYEGQIVYKEISGELESYAPDASWEDGVNLFYEMAKKMHRKESINTKKEAEEKKEVEKANILEQLRKKWGI